ncbi:MAG: hypothetical protein ACRCST_17185 [Turicibacter sp.]
MAKPFGILAVLGILLLTITAIGTFLDLIPSEKTSYFLITSTILCLVPTLVAKLSGRK